VVGDGASLITRGGTHMANRLIKNGSSTVKTHYLYFAETRKDSLYNTSRPITRTLQCLVKLGMSYGTIPTWQTDWSKTGRLFSILLAFITGNSSLEPWLKGLFAQIHIELSWRGFGRNRTGDLRMTQICSGPRSSPLSYGDSCITEDPSGPYIYCENPLLILPRNA